jgi:flavin reductase (DIM6/NTAB) family NADH-FMN oxidoreductase RutF
LFCSNQTSRVPPFFRVTQSFALNVEYQESMSWRFSHAMDKRIEEETFYHGSTGTPFLAGALAYLDCDFYRQIDAGDHVIMIDQVRDFRVQWAAGPLPVMGWVSKSELAPAVQRRLRVRKRFSKQVRNRGARQFDTWRPCQKQSRLST